MASMAHSLVKRGFESVQQMQHTTIQVFDEEPFKLPTWSIPIFIITAVVYVVHLIAVRNLLHKANLENSRLTY